MQQGDRPVNPGWLRLPGLAPYIAKKYPFLKAQVTLKKGGKLPLFVSRHAT